MWSGFTRDLIGSISIKSDAHRLAWLNNQPVIELAGIIALRLAALVYPYTENLCDSIGRIAKMKGGSIVDTDSGTHKTSTGHADIGVEDAFPDEKRDEKRNESQAQ